MSRLCAYVVTSRALRDLTGLPSMPSHWFDWELPAVHVGGEPLRRFRVVKSADFGSNQEWVNAVSDLGLMPYLLVSFDEGMPTGDWPTSDSWLTPVGVHCIDARFRQECDAIADELSQPDQSVLDQWSAFWLGVREPLEAIETPQQLHRPYADGVAAWLRSPQTAQLTDRFAEPDYSKWNDAISLGVNDFAFWPAHALSQDERDELYIPLKAFPFCGVGVRSGEPVAFGFLPQAGDGRWPFGDELRRLLLQSLTTQSFKATIGYLELMARISGPSILERPRIAQVLKGSVAHIHSFDLNLGKAAHALGARAELTSKWDVVHLTLGPSRRRGDDRHVLQLHGAAATQKVAIRLLDVRTGEIVLNETLDGEASGVGVRLAAGVDLDSCQIELELG